ncbi:MAG TPA: phosphatidylserine decarboxylase [Alphaproteobacteria bacterium]|nr:phosphatidylserine decarboxylase [Alphaproteobacteria bacterium]
MEPLPTSFLAPIHRDGWRFLALFALATVLLFWLVWPLGWVGLALTAWCAYFFRDPERVTPLRPGLIISPADGVVLPIVEAPPPPELGMGAEPLTRVSIFMNVFDVHVNRVPCDARVMQRAYHPGRFLNASLDKASEHNERLALKLAIRQGETEREIAVVQIAGLVARRIVCEVVEGQQLRAGARFGLIRFGSRVDVYLPPGVAPLVAAGQRMIAGETVIADLDGIEPPRRGEVR